MILLADDLEAMGRTAVDEFNAGPVKDRSTQSDELELRAQRLEAKLEQLYAVAATMAQHEEVLGSVAGIWSRMVRICDAMAKAVTDLYRGKGAPPSSHDRILDIRNACEENRALHA